MEDACITEGETIKFKCESSKASKPIWKRNGKEISEGDRIKMESSGVQHTLTIHGALIDDEAAYTCQVKEQSTSAKLKVKELSVRIIDNLKDQYVREGETATFDLSTSKKTEAYQWFKEDREIRRFDARYKLSSDEFRLYLKIIDAELGDEALFKCQVGEEVTTARLHVEG